MVASEKTVTTATAQKTKKYEINRGRRNYVSKQTSVSREPVASYSYLESKETLKEMCIRDSLYGVLHISV